MTTAERTRLPLIASELAKSGIIPERWELEAGSWKLEALTHDALMKFGDINMHFEAVEDWTEFN